MDLFWFPDSLRLCIHNMIIPRFFMDFLSLFATDRMWQKMKKEKKIKQSKLVCIQIFLLLDWLPKQG